MSQIDRLLSKGIILKGDKDGVSIPRLIYDSGNVIMYYRGYFRGVGLCYC